MVAAFKITCIYHSRRNTRTVDIILFNIIIIPTNLGLATCFLL